MRQEVLAQLEECRRGHITEAELEAAREALLSALRGVYDSPGSIESYFGTQLLNGAFRSPEQYRDEILGVTMEDAVAAARTLRLHTTYFLKGAEK